MSCFKRLLAILGCVMAATLGGVTPTLAQDSGQTEGIPLVLAVVDMNEVLAKASATQDIRAQIEEKRKIYQSEIQQEEQELREANQQLAKQRTILSPEAFKEEREKFEKRFVKAQRKMQQRKRELDQARNGALEKVRDALRGVVTELVKKNNITLILRKEQTVFVAKAMDVTPHVIAGLDKVLPSVVVFPKGGQPGEDSDGEKGAK
jgi:Skp family chaperone for outer membrane proteins